MNCVNISGPMNLVVVNRPGVQHYPNSTSPRASLPANHRPTQSYSAPRAPPAARNEYDRPIQRSESAREVRYQRAPVREIRYQRVPEPIREIKYEREQPTRTPDPIGEAYPGAQAYQPREIYPPSPPHAYKTHALASPSAMRGYPPQSPPRELEQPRRAPKPLHTTPYSDSLVPAPLRPSLDKSRPRAYQQPNGEWIVEDPLSGQRQHIHIGLPRDSYHSADDDFAIGQAIGQPHEIPISMYPTDYPAEHDYLLSALRSPQYHPAEEYPADEYAYPDEDDTNEENPLEEYLASEYPLEDYFAPAEGYPASEYPAEEYPTENHTASEYPPEEYPPPELPTETYPTELDNYILDPTTSTPPQTPRDDPRQTMDFYLALQSGTDPSPRTITSPDPRQAMKDDNAQRKQMAKAEAVSDLDFYMALRDGNAPDVDVKESALLKRSQTTKGKEKVGRMKNWRGTMDFLSALKKA